MSRRGGFTLLELLVVVTIIGLLASIAIPQYLRTVERARMVEAIIVLGQLRTAQVSYKAQTGKFANKLTHLSFSPTDTSGTPIFEYLDPVTDPPGATFDIRAKRKSPADGAPAVGTGCVENYMLHIDQTGQIKGQDCQSAS